MSSIEEYRRGSPFPGVIRRTIALSSAAGLAFAVSRQLISDAKLELARPHGEP